MRGQAARREGWTLEFGRGQRSLGLGVIDEASAHWVWCAWVCLDSCSWTEGVPWTWSGVLGLPGLILLSEGWSACAHSLGWTGVAQRCTWVGDGFPWIRLCSGTLHRPGGCTNPRALILLAFGFKTFTFFQIPRAVNWLKIRFRNKNNFQNKNFNKFFNKSDSSTSCRNLI